MVPFHALLAFCCLSTASPATLKPRTNPASSYTTELVRRAVPCTSQTCPLVSNERLKFLGPITLGTQTFLAEIDTGSSDTWIIQTGFKCYPEGSSLNASAKTLPEKHCNFGPTWTPDASYSPLPDVLLDDSYGGGARQLVGPLGYENVTFCGFNIPQQLVGAPTRSSFLAAGLKEQSGLVGMAFPALTSAYNITPGAPNNGSYIYNNVPQSLFDVEAYTPPLAKEFTFAISRDNSNSGYGGSFTMGGIPSLSDPRVNAFQASSSAPLEPAGGPFAAYAINVTSFTVGKATHDANAQVIVDSGTPNLILPPKTGTAFNKAWLPACIGHADGYCILDCKAKNSMHLGVSVGGTIFGINPVDLKLPNNATTCYSAVQTSTKDSSGVYILGDTFLRNVVSVFDWGNSQMTFYSRMHYKS